MKKFFMLTATMCVVLVMSLFLQSSAPYAAVLDLEAETAATVTAEYVTETPGAEESATGKEYTVVIVPATEKEEMNKKDDKEDNKAYLLQHFPESLPGYSHMCGDTSVLTIEQANSVKKGMHYKEVAALIGNAFVSGPLSGFASEIFLVEGGYTLTIVYCGPDFGAYVGGVELSNKTWISVEGMRDYIEKGNRATADNKEEVLKLWMPSLAPDAEQ